MIGAKKKEKNFLREIRFLNDILKDKDYGMAISKEKVIFMHVTEREQIDIKIENPAFAELQKNIFSFLWEKAEK